MIKVGPAGTSGLGFPDGLYKCEELGLKALEWEFTYGVRMKKEDAIKVGELAKKLKLDMSVHAPYYVNLASKEKVKVDASKKRILQSAERGSYLNADYVVFHAGFYQERSAEEVYGMIKEEILKLQKTIKEKKWNVILAPETTGKSSQFGDIDELLRLRKDTRCHLTVDWAHIRARNNGIIDYDEIFKKLRGISHIHSHFSGIEWTAKGERRHLITPEQEIKELFSYVRKYKLDVTIINESPDPYGDCVKMKRILESL